MARFFSAACGLALLVVVSAAPAAHPDSQCSAAGVVAANRTVLIIGAGPAGSSLAYFLSQRGNANVDVTVYEKESRVGGRVLDVVVHDEVSKSNHVIELGASIFLKGNEILYNASRDFGLLPRMPSSQANSSDSSLHDGERAFAVYDGKHFVFSPAPFLFKLAMLWRYGISLFLGKRLGQQALERFVRIYTTSQGFSTPANLTAFVGWTEYLATNAATLLDSNWISQRFSSEIVQGVSRTNYAQNLVQINAVGALVGVIPSPALHVPSGNSRIFEHMLARSRAAVRLNTTVTSIRRAPGGRGYAVATRGGERVFDVVVLAAPSPGAGIAFEQPLMSPPAPLKYVHLHVTIVLGVVKPEYFRASLAAFPRTIMTLPTCELFNSFSTLRRLPSRGGGAAGGGWGGRGIFKVFSNRELSDKEIGRMFGSCERVIRKDWHSYPFLVPRTGNDEQLAGFILDERVSDDGSCGGGLYYLNGFEGVMCSMESQAVAARNMANLLDDKLFRQCPVDSV